MNEFEWISMNLHGFKGIWMDFNGFDFLSKPIHIKPIAGGAQDAYMERHSLSIAAGFTVVLFVFSFCVSLLLFTILVCCHS